MNAVLPDSLLYAAKRSSAASAAAPRPPHAQLRARAVQRHYRVASPLP